MDYTIKCTGFLSVLCRQILYNTNVISGHFNLQKNIYNYTA